MRDASEIERGIMALAPSSNAGLIVTAGGPSIVHRDLIIKLAAQLKMPAVYRQCVFASSGGLISYGDDANDQYRRAASYVDRILKGEKPADSGPGANQVRARHQPQDCEGAPSLLARADAIE